MQYKNMLFHSSQSCRRYGRQTVVVSQSPHVKNVATVPSGMLM